LEKGIFTDCLAQGIQNVWKRGYLQTLLYREYRLFGKGDIYRLFSTGNTDCLERGMFTDCLAQGIQTVCTGVI